MEMTKSFGKGKEKVRAKADLMKHLRDAGMDTSALETR